METIPHSRPTQRRACDSFMRRRRRAIARDCDWHKLRQRLCGWPYGREIKAEQQAAAAAYKETRRAARWMQQARRECRQLQWDELPNS